MGKLLAILARAPKRTGTIIAIIAAAIVVPATLFAWGPDRATFTEAHPAPYVTFNSITDNSAYGDERNFVTVKDAANTNDGGWTDNVTVQPGKEYVVRMYVHNNAAADLKLVAKNVRASASVPTTTAKSVPISGFVSADNAKPGKVFDDITLNSSKEFNLAYVPGSASYHNNSVGKATDGAKLGDSIVTSAGAQLGYDKLDGNIPGCYQYSGYVYFKVKPQFASTDTFDMSKQVRKTGDTAWKDSVATKPGDSVDYLVSYKNTGETDQKDVTVKDTLPAGMSYVAGSTKLTNTTNPNGLKTSDNLTKSTGINIGGYAPGGGAYVTFSAKVASNDALPTCGPNSLVNKATVIVNGGAKDDTATVTVPKECQPEKPTPSYTCDALTVDKIDRTHFKFDTKYTLKNATFKSVAYVIKDSTGKEISRSSNATYTQEKPGTYSVQAIVTVTVDGKDKTVTSEGCEKQFTVTPPKTVQVCNPATGKVITVDEKDQDKYKPVGDKACQPPEECKPGVPVGSKDCEEKPPVDECKPGVPTGSEDCKDNCTVPGKEHLPSDSPDCVETPVTPPVVTPPTTPETPAELPHTGIGDTIVTLIGAGSLIAAVGYYVASRRIGTN